MKPQLNDWVYSIYRLRTAGEHHYSLDFHSHPHYEIYLFHQGDCKYLINHTIYPLEPGDIIIMDGMTAHRANPSPDSMYERSVLHFSREWIEPLLETMGMNHLMLPFTELNNVLLRGGESEEREELLRCIKRITSILNYQAEERLAQHIYTADLNREEEAEMKILIIQCLIKIYTISQRSVGQLTMKKGEKDIHTERAAAYIQQHFEKPITLDDIAEALNISKFYLSRVFKEVTGTTLMDYVMACRLNKVKYELEMNPHKVLVDVALDAGFESPAHFSRFFKKKVGMSPSVYRQKRREVKT